MNFTVILQSKDFYKTPKDKLDTMTSCKRDHIVYKVVLNYQIKGKVRKSSNFLITRKILFYLNLTRFHFILY